LQPFLKLQTILENQRDYSLSKLLNIARAFEEKESLEGNFKVDSYKESEETKQGNDAKSASHE